MPKWNDRVERAQARKQLAPIVATGKATCGHCGKPINPRQPWHVGHSADRTLMSPWHATCNLRDAQAKAAATRTKRRRTEPHPGKRATPGG